MSLVSSELRSPIDRDNISVRRSRLTYRALEFPIRSLLLCILRPPNDKLITAGAHRPALRPAHRSSPWKTRNRIACPSNASHKATSSDWISNVGTPGTPHHISFRYLVVIWSTLPVSRYRSRPRGVYARRIQRLCRGGKRRSITTSACGHRAW